MVYAGLGIRLAAFVIDAVVLAVAALLLMGASSVLRLLAALAPGEARWLGAPLAGILGAPSAVAVVALVAAYWPVCEALWGATLGKGAMRLRVRREDAGPADWRGAIVRRLSLYLGILWLDALVILLTPRRQRAFDLLAGTVVVWHGPPVRLLG